MHSQLSPRISTDEFSGRIAKIQHALRARGLRALLVWGDEYRRENLRYVSNFWPIFERAACFIPAEGAPLVAAAPEGEQYLKEQCVWPESRNVKEFACVSVPEEIDYPNATFTPLKEIVAQALDGGTRLGLVGMFDIPAPIYARIQQSVPGLEIVDAADILQELRLVKTEAEIACLKEAGRLADLAYQQLIRQAVPGNTELMAAGAAEGAARQAGAEAIVFTVFGSGPRADTVIGRPVNRVIQDGDMVMAALAVQYEGYIATVEYPFVAGTPTDGQKWFLDALFEAANVQYGYLKDGVVAGEMVRAVHAVFRKHGLQAYDLYPPMHGIGLAEAESPYPDEQQTYLMRAGMCVNSDISLFGHPHGSNRIEEGFVIRPDGPESLTPYVRQLVEAGVISTNELVK